MGSTRVEECRGCVGEVAFRHQVVRLDNTVDIAAVDANSNTHDHLLWALGHATIDAEEIRAFKRLEAKTRTTVNNRNNCKRRNTLVVVEITVVDDGRVEGFGVVTYDLVGFLRNHPCRLVVLGVDYWTLARIQKKIERRTIFVEILDDLRKGFLCFFVEIRDGKAGSQDGVVGVFGREVRGSLSSKVLGALSASNQKEEIKHVRPARRWLHQDTRQQRPSG